MNECNVCGEFDYGDLLIVDRAALEFATALAYRPLSCLAILRTNPSVIEAPAREALRRNAIRLYHHRWPGGEDLLRVKYLVAAEVLLEMCEERKKQDPESRAPWKKLVEDVVAWFQGQPSFDVDEAKSFAHRRFLAVNEMENQAWRCELKDPIQIPGFGSYGGGKEHVTIVDKAGVFPNRPLGLSEAEWAKQPCELKVAFKTGRLAEVNEVLAKWPYRKGKEFLNDISELGYRIVVSIHGRPGVGHAEFKAVMKKIEADFVEQSVFALEWGQEEPLVKKEEPLVKKEEPQTKKDEPQTNKEEPQTKKEEPQTKKEAPQSKKEEKG